MLAPGEEQIASIDEEMMRRSPDLTHLFDQFVVCGPNCKGWPSILLERDVVVKRDWPMVFDRLRVGKDWGTTDSAELAHDAFSKALKGKGPDRLRYVCIPRIGFHWPVRGNRPVAVYQFDGFACDDPSRPPPA
jgi:hypothetical protein